jgi:tRNA pseudouridine38-40 synthase
MIRNIMGCLVTIGQGFERSDWMHEVLQARSRQAASPTFSPDGLYFLGPVYEERWGLPTHPPAYDWLP